MVEYGTLFLKTLIIASNIVLYFAGWHSDNLQLLELMIKTQAPGYKVHKDKGAITHTKWRAIGSWVAFSADSRM